MTRLRPQGEGIPLPRPTSVSQPFWAGCSEGRLLFQRCQGCGRPQFIPTVMCRNCQERTLVWEESSGRGTVYSWSVVWRPQSQAFSVPYAPAIIELDEGYQMLSNVIDCEPEEVRIGLPVSVSFHPIGGGISYPYFRPHA